MPGRRPSTSASTPATGHHHQHAAPTRQQQTCLIVPHSFRQITSDT
jgi:hypothetical protein